MSRRQPRFRSPDGHRPFSPTEQRTVAFFCSTPFQIIVAFAIMRTLGDNTKADIYVLNHFRDAERIADNLRSCGHFARCKLVDSRGFLESLREGRPNSLKNSELLRRLQTAWAFLNSRNLIGKYLAPGTARYDDVYLSYPDLLVRLALDYFCRRNTELRVHLMEDGLGSYDPRLWKSSGKQSRVFLSVFSHVPNGYDELLVFRPELLTEKVPFPVTKLESFRADDEAMHALRSVFGYEHCPLSQRVIFLEQPFNEQWDQKIAEIVRRILPFDSLVKIHPRGKSGKHYSDFAQFDDASLPWELVESTNDMADKILISFFSSAATSSKMLFDAEPQLIFLYRVPELREVYLAPKLENFLESFRMSYSDPSRVRVPGSMEECRALIAEMTANPAQGTSSSDRGQV